MYRMTANITINNPVIENQRAPLFSMKSPNFWPNKLVKYETKKKRKPLVTKHIKKKTGRL